jgi:hypothetical protein
MVKQAAKDYAELSPYKLLRELPELASNSLPVCLEAYCSISGLQAWELLEEGVYYFFRQILMLETIRLGSNCLFRQEPEGVVLVGRDPDPFALLYECKARSEPYRMSSDDLLRYRRYIRQKRHEVRIKYHLNLTHFVIVAPEFAGNLDLRLAALDSEGVVTSLIPASTLRICALTMQQLSYSDIHLLEVRHIFVRGIGGIENLKSCLGCELVGA